MTLITIATWFASGLAVSAAITACFAARRGSVGRLLTRFSALQARFEELADQVQVQETTLMNLRSRITMQATREKRLEARASNGSTPQSDDSSKADVRKALGAQLANGTIKPIGR